MTKRKKIIVICAFLLISFIIPNKVKAKESASVKYQTHVQDIGWQTQVKDGEIAGTEGQSKRLEAIKIELKNLENIKINLFENSFSKCWDYIIEESSKLFMPKGCVSCDKREICQVCIASVYCENGNLEKSPKYLCDLTDEMLRILK